MGSGVGCKLISHVHMLALWEHFVVGQERQHLVGVWSVGSAVAVPGFQSRFLLTSDPEKVSELFCVSDLSSVRR